MPLQLFTRRVAEPSTGPSVASLGVCRVKAVQYRGLGVFQVGQPKDGFRATVWLNRNGHGQLLISCWQCERKVSGWTCTERLQLIERIWLRGVDLSHRPLGYECGQILLIR